MVADGPVRDIDEARTYKFPIYCRSLTAKTARGRVVEAEVNGPVTIGELVVNAGDYVLATPVELRSFALLRSALCFLLPR